MNPRDPFPMFRPALAVPRIVTLAIAAAALFRVFS